MKKLILLLAIAIGTTQFSMAQEAAQKLQTAPNNGQAQVMPPGKGTMPTPEQHAKRQTDMMAQQLTLDEATKTKVYNVNLKYAQKQDELRKAGKTKEEMIAAMKQMSTDKDNDMKAVLSAEQYKNYTAKRGQMQPGMQMMQRATPAQPAQPAQPQGK